jgi:type I site-specific restriction endonuclease
VDRNNLGKQTLNEFQQYFSPYTNRKFTEEYTVQHLKRNAIDPASKVCITTIQRLYSMLKGEEEFLGSPRILWKTPELVYHLGSEAEEEFLQQ